MLQQRLHTLRGYVHRIPDTTPREWWWFIRKQLAKDESLASFNDACPCVFVLSTGRVGTQTLAALMGLAPHLSVYHEPAPKLFGLSRLAYMHTENDLVRQALREAFLSAREALFDHSLTCGRGYVETSPQTTFLAPIVAEFLPTVRFIHLVRDPHKVIRSGMRRGWYEGHVADRTRLQPLSDDPHATVWHDYTSFQKNAWLWTETNRWILSFLKSIPLGRQYRLKAEDMFSGDKATLTQLFAFVNSPMPTSRKTERVLERKLNAQRTGEFPSPEEWSDAMNTKLVTLTATVASQLGYKM